MKLPFPCPGRHLHSFIHVSHSPCHHFLILTSQEEGVPMSTGRIWIHICHFPGTVSFQPTQCNFGQASLNYASLGTEPENLALSPAVNHTIPLAIVPVSSHSLLSATDGLQVTSSVLEYLHCLVFTGNSSPCSLE